jgi:hypothetical protein
MATQKDYERVCSEIEKQGGLTSFRNSDYGGCELLCASRMNEDSTLGGNSFWIWFDCKSRLWYLSTWAPCHYQLPSFVNIAELCMRCLLLSNSAIPSLPDAIIAEFSLSELSAIAFDSLYEA